MAYMSKRHEELEKEFLKIPQRSRTPQVYIALCKAAKIRESAIRNRLSAMKLFRLEEAPAAPAPETPPPPMKKPVKGEKPPKKKRSWEEEFEAALKGEDEPAPAPAKKEEKDEDDDEDGE